MPSVLMTTSHLRAKWHWLLLSTLLPIFTPPKIDQDAIAL